MFHQHRRRPDLARRETAAAIGADAFQHTTGAIRANRALESADARVSAFRRKIAAAAFAIGPKRSISLAP